MIANAVGAVETLWQERPVQHAIQRNKTLHGMHSRCTSVPRAWPRRTGRTGGATRVITPGTVLAEARLQRGSAHQAALARGIRRVVTPGAVTPHTGRGAGTAHQAIMTGGVRRVIAASAVTSLAEG